MQRRQLIRYGALSYGSLLMHIIPESFGGMMGQSTTMPTKQGHYDWGILYWMPYDNDLTYFGLPIIEMLKQGIQHPNLLVLVESDFAADPGLSRRILTKRNEKIQVLNQQNSASEQTLADYLTWAGQQFSVKKWAIAILGHGGNFDEISPDDHPRSSAVVETQWMNIAKLGQVLARFNTTIAQAVELFFLQNCNKGTIEALYTVRHAARYTLSSQLTLGAPNYYYESLLQFVGQHPGINGKQLAAKIMEFERKDMYHSYTVVDNSAIAHLPDYLNPLINAILAGNLKAISLEQLQPYTYMDDYYVDVLACFEQLTTQSGASRAPLQQFANFVQTRLICKMRQDGDLFEPHEKAKYQKFSGLGMFFPKHKADRDRYRHLPAFTDLGLAKLFDAIFTT